MYEIRETEHFAKWLRKLKDSQARRLIVSRLDRLGFGHEGDSKNLGNGVQELRIHVGGGYRVYYTKRDGRVIILLCAGNKSSGRVRKYKTLKKLSNLLKRCSRYGAKDKKI